MNPEIFWQLIGDVCKLGEFVIGIDFNGIEVNLVGKFEVFFDGHENVLERSDCGDHFHIAAGQMRALSFEYFKVSTGHDDPCVAIVNQDGQVPLRLMIWPYEENQLKPMWKKFVSEHKAYEEFLIGEW